MKMSFEEYSEKFKDFNKSKLGFINFKDNETTFIDRLKLKNIVINTKHHEISTEKYVVSNDNKTYLVTGNVIITAFNDVSCIALFEEYYVNGDNGYEHIGYDNVFLYSYDTLECLMDAKSNVIKYINL